MKRLAIALSIILLLAILCPCFSMLAQPTHIPHQNPLTAKDSPDPVSLLLFYGDVFDLGTTRQYHDAQSMLADLDYANIPDELHYIIDRLNSLSQQLFTTLDNLELLLDEASALLSQYRISDAEQKLNATETMHNNIRLLLGYIDEAASPLGDRLGIFTALASNPLKQAYERLEKALDRLRQLTNELNQLRQSLVDKYEVQAQVELTPTELNLSVEPASIFIGDTITASGRLTTDTIPLSNRKLTLLLDNEPLVITTSLDGSYTTSIPIPYKYIPIMTLSTVYTPSGDDIGTYLASESLPVIVSTSFYPTSLEVSTPETAHPGLPITITGQVSSTNGNIARTIKVFLDNTQLAEEIIQDEFSFQITPPPQISTGKHSLTLIATPQERYSGSSKSLTINISRLPIQADIELPQLIFIPQSIQISGKVYHSIGPVEDARVSLIFGQSSTTVKTSTDGSFIANLELPLDFSLVGPQELSVIIKPVQPWYASPQIRRRVLTLNSLNMGLMLIALICLGILLYIRIPRRQEKITIPEVEVTVREPPTVTPSIRPSYEFTDIKGRILSAYLNGLETVEKVTGISMAPHTTLREFLKATTSLLPSAIKSFTELTIAAEIAVYSAHKLDSSSAARAEQLTATINKELS